MEAAITAFSQDLYEAMQQPDDRGPRGKSARQKALDELVRRYCLGDMRTGGRDEAMEAAANAAAAETRVVLLQWKLEQERGSAKAAQRATLHQNSQLLRELQVSQGDLRLLKDRYDAAWVALRELQSKYNLLERRWAASQGGGGRAARRLVSWKQRMSRVRVWSAWLVGYRLRAPRRVSLARVLPMAC
ncbi:hypothetical protein HYH02_015537 [Chlamydomonas schloesseri]|uniref:Uncharacterized protein n=1 Tax=Chlamydomonas schloesseri TaxID=2026947 RepID=A0A835VQR3_9CHLO|nr:hypothetical protein HYH02_015537 [Chlamydomonas schloesseri]|eukprot:KAG2422024.1 hypothetical protein HYH02_015537 [Chlamydomonas schloesseri]